MTPKQKTITVDMRPYRRPRKSATGAPNRAPKNYEHVSLVSMSTDADCTYFASRKQGDDLGLLARRNSWHVGLGVYVARVELLQPIRHGQDTANGSGVISEQDTSKCHEEADHNGWPRLARRAWWWSKSERHGCEFHSDVKSVEISIDVGGVRNAQAPDRMSVREKTCRARDEEHNLQSYRGKGRVFMRKLMSLYRSARPATRCDHQRAVPQTKQSGVPMVVEPSSSSKGR